MLFGLALLDWTASLFRIHEWFYTHRLRSRSITRYQNYTSHPLPLSLLFRASGVILICTTNAAMVDTTAMPRRIAGSTFVAAAHSKARPTRPTPTKEPRKAVAAMRTYMIRFRVAYPTRHAVGTPAANIVYHCQPSYA